MLGEEAVKRSIMVRVNGFGSGKSQGISFQPKSGHPVYAKTKKLC